MNDRIRYYIPQAVVALVALTAYAFMVSEGTWSLIGIGWGGAAYDEMAKSFVKSGKVGVDCGILGFEAMRVNGVCYMYFGLWPSVVRLPFVLVDSPWVGSLSRLSCLIAATLSVAAVSAITSIGAVRAPFFSAFLLLGASLGTPLLFLITSTAIYHEANIWGLTGTLWCAAAVIRAMNRPQHYGFWFVVASAASGVALLSRLTFSISCMVMLLALIAFTFRFKRAGLKKMALWLLPSCGAVAVQMWYNHARFGSVWAVAGGDTFNSEMSKVGGQFNIARVPDQLRLFFGFGPEHLSRKFPWIKMAVSSYLYPDLFLKWREPLIPLTLSAPWLLFSFLLGLFYLWRAKNTLGLVTVGFLLVCWMPIVCFLFSSERYLSEFLPAMIFTAGLAWADPKGPLYRPPVQILVSLLIVFSVGVTAANDFCWVADWMRGFTWFSAAFRESLRTYMADCGGYLM